LREKYCWLIAGGWFVLREKYCWLVADKPNEQRDDTGDVVREARLKSIRARHTSKPKRAGHLINI
jgi:hypothetical protein